MRGVLAILTAAAIAVPAAAQTPLVDSARRAGSVGERFDGYLGYAVPPTAQLRSQVDAINIRRRALYSNLAAARGVSPQEVSITAGCQLLGRVAVGQAYMLSDGAWRRRGAGRAMPRPGYCG